MEVLLRVTRRPVAPLILYSSKLTDLQEFLCQHSRKQNVQALLPINKPPPTTASFQGPQSLTASRLWNAAILSWSVRQKTQSPRSIGYRHIRVHDWYRRPRRTRCGQIRTSRARTFHNSFRDRQATPPEDIFPQSRRRSRSDFEAAFSCKYLGWRSRPNAQ